MARASAARLIPSLVQSSAIDTAICLHKELQNETECGSVSAHFMLSSDRSHPPSDPDPIICMLWKPPPPALVGVPAGCDEPPPPPASESQHASPWGTP